MLSPNGLSRQRSGELDYAALTTVPALLANVRQIKTVGESIVIKWQYAGDNKGRWRVGVLPCGALVAG
jgi:hypothetical protein